MRREATDAESKMWWLLRDFVARCRFGITFWISFASIDGSWSKSMEASMGRSKTKLEMEYWHLRDFAFSVIGIITCCGGPEPLWKIC